MESPSEQFRALLLEAAPLLENAQSIFRKDESAWVIIFADDVFVELYVDERLRKMVLSMPVGRPNNERRASTYQVLFVVNGLWRETGGLRFSLDEPDGEIEQCLDLNLDHLSIQKLVAILQDFTDRGRTWQDIIAEHGGLSAEEDETPPAAFGTQPFIRV